MYKHNFFPINQTSSRPTLACRSPIPFSSYPDSISVLSDGPPSALNRGVPPTGLVD